MQEYKVAENEIGRTGLRIARMGVERELFDQLFDFATKVADDDWGLSRRELVKEARTLLGRTYSSDEESGPPADR
jgi:hypothetical protein